MASSLRKAARDHLLAFVATQEASGDHIAVDVWRVLQEESKLLFETQCIRDLIDQDPFQCYKDVDDKALQQAVQQFQRSIQVTSCHRLEKEDDYCYTEATVQYRSTILSSSPAAPLTKKQKRQPKKDKSDDFIQLFFRYERQPATHTNDNDTTPVSTSSPTTIFYSIDMCQNYGPKQNIVTIRCWAEGNKPSKLPAVSIDDDEDADDDDDWEDIDDDEAEKIKKEQKEAPTKTNDNKKSSMNGKKTGSTTVTSEKAEKEKNGNHQENEEEEVPDRYACFVDPDVLQTFQSCTQLTAMDQATTFFTLMSFPYYQHEWDLVGFVLDSVFGYNEEEGEDDDDDDED